MATTGSVSHFLSVLSMWFLMSIAMMLPSAAPAILTFSDLAERARQTARPLSEGAFIIGYLLAWLSFDALASGAQLTLADMSHRFHSAAHAIAFGCLLMLAGVYQFAPLKQACLTKCRNPMTFFLAHWREGTGGALRLGMHHGAYCIGCCWALMLLMVATGTMNLGLTAGLAVLMLAEKILPGGLWIGRGVGVGLVAWGILWVAPDLIN
jgi:predicted metal-binding membrane protein